MKLFLKKLNLKESKYYYSNIIKMATEQEKKKAAKIIGIQFSILSPEEIRNGSVAEITNRDTYINNKPIIGGLFDPRMGVLDPGLICPTDGLDYMKTPGYFGHINLARPVFYIQYLNTLIKIIRCTCIKCGKLLIDKEKYKYLLKMRDDQRWNHVFSLASKIKRCGEDTHDGCGCKQPNKIKKEGLATLIAEWDNVDGLSSEDSDKLSVKLLPENVLKNLRRISDEDVSFMGFSPIWSRPEWMVCQVLAVPPPAVRPSVKHDSQQRSEDDISHIIVNIIKANKTLQDKISQNANTNVIDDWTTVLQYYCATLVDNKIPGVASVAQRSGRPLKSIKERLNGKTGRVRGNLMGKRVDFSARSVITPDPNLSISELGVPLKIAKNLTKPVKVNEKNRLSLLKLVQNGPDEYPGAKILERKNGENISLRYVDRKSIRLELGDIVHRHVIDGDAILFNRQPTLHRMSMMCHIVKVMPIGDTFRMNVADTKPYNADFDGDEMNLHMPQDDEAEIELRNLAAVKYQIISPANNKTIIGIFQDSLLGCYRFTRKNIKFNPRETMNLLMNFDKIDINKLDFTKEISSFEILSQIMLPLSIEYKTKKFTDSEDYKESNNVVQIENGEYLRGQIEKGVLGDGAKGLLQRITKDFGYQKGAQFIDNLQNIITEYMKSSAFSVGISDLVANKLTRDLIADSITSKKAEVKSILDEIHLGIFENKSGKTNEQAFEVQVNNILNKASMEAGKIGRKSLSSDNRFVTLVNSGSKGSDLNISQMIACLGQQNVDGKRIPYGFDQRTLPHFTKFDDSPSARGFVESSFIGGLKPEELFFHAMGGRVGLIDTAVKTSQTGYIQRRLVKGLEDLIVDYSMVVRNNKRKIIQFKYGEDGFDPVQVENQYLPLLSLNLEEIYSHFQMPKDATQKAIYTTLYTKSTLKKVNSQIAAVNEKCKKYIEFMIKSRDLIIEKVFKNKDQKVINLPVPFFHIINNIQGQQNINEKSMVDITPLEVFEIIEKTYNNLEKLYYSKPNELFKVLYYYYLSPKDLLMNKRFNKKAIEILCLSIVNQYKKAIIAPGEMVGIIAAQSIGEPTTQMTLNTFHFAGVASKSNVTRGVPRIEEILSLSENPKNPSCTIYLKEQDESSQDKAKEIMYFIEHTKFQEIVESIQICFDPDDLNTLIEEDTLLLEQYKTFESLVDECNEEVLESSKEKSKWIIRIKLNAEEMLDKNISMDDINFAIDNMYKTELSCIYSDYNSDKLIFRLRLNTVTQKKKVVQNPLDQSDEIYLLKNFQDQLLNNLVLRGVKNISKVVPRKIMDNVKNIDGSFVKKDMWVLDTVGTNLIDLLGNDSIDPYRTFTNDIQEIYRILGIEAMRQAIFNELSEVIEFDSTYINYHHLSLLADRMTASDHPISIFRHGINNDDIGPLAKASFEETPEMFLKAARHGELDNMRGISGNVICGQEGYFGTNCFQVLLNINKIDELPEAKSIENDNTDELIEQELMMNKDDPCNIQNLTIESNIQNLHGTQLGDNDYEIDI